MILKDESFLVTSEMKNTESLLSFIKSLLVSIVVRDLKVFKKQCVSMDTSLKNEFESLVNVLQRFSKQKALWLKGFMLLSELFCSCKSYNEVLNFLNVRKHILSVFMKFLIRIFLSLLFLTIFNF